jgi:ParB-like chromosome segregation protein Spo0J
VEIHVLSISKLVPYSRQLRKNDHAVAHMAASINEYGFKIPALDAAMAP